MMVRARWRRRDRCTAHVLLAALLLPSALQAQSANTLRFELRGELQAAQRSIDGRFAVGGSATFQTAHATPDGRFTLKATHVPAGSCGALPDLIFADGFED